MRTWTTRRERWPTSRFFVSITSDSLCRRIWFLDILLGVRRWFELAIKLQNPWTSGARCTKLETAPGAEDTSRELIFVPVIKNTFSVTKRKLFSGHNGRNPICRVRIWGTVLPETGLGGLKTGFLLIGRFLKLLRFVPKSVYDINRRRWVRIQVYLCWKPVFGSKTGFCYKWPMFQVSPIKTKTGVRYNSKALSTITVFIFPENCFWGGKAAFCHE